MNPKAYTLLSAFLLLSLTALAEKRTWTSADGRTLLGEMIKADAESVTISLPGKTKPVVIPLNKLSAADQTWVAEHPIAAPAAPAGAPKPPMGTSAGKKSSGGRITAKGSHLELDGKPWTAKGICYHPVPIGKKAGGGDLCADEQSDLWERDIPNLKSLGASLIRLYAWDTEVSHKKFLKALSSGDQPIHVIVNKYIKPETNWADPATVEELVAKFTAIAKDIAKEPLVMGLAIGNEANAHGPGDTDDFWKAHEKIAAAVKKEAPDTLIMVPITDKLAHVEKAEPILKSVDLWALQIYRGDKFGKLFKDYEAISKRPLLLTEYGMDAYDARIKAEGAKNAAFVADAFDKLSDEMNKAKDSCSGGCWFSYSDEWWKASGADDAQDTSGNSNSFPDGEGNEEWYGIYRIAPGTPNVLTPRALAEAMQKRWNK